MHRTITIVLANDNQDREEIDITARKVLDSIQENLFDDPEITLNRPNDFELTAKTKLSDSDWLDAVA